MSPSTKVRYLCIEIDTVDMELHLPKDTIERVLQEVTVMMEKQWTSVKAFEKLVGYLAQCAAVIRRSRMFMRRLFNVLKKCKNKRRICITETCRDDLRWWRKFIVVFTGSVKILDGNCEVEVMCTDSSTSGFGTHTDTDYTFGFWAGVYLLA